MFAHFRVQTWCWRSSAAQSAVLDCVDFMPIPTPGRQYALTHIYTGMMDEENHNSPRTFSAWVDAAPNLRHYGCKHCFCESEGMGIDFLEAAAELRISRPSICLDG